MHTQPACGKIYVDIVTNMDSFFINLIAKGIHSRLGKK